MTHLFRDNRLCRLPSSPAEPSLQSQNFLAMGCDRFGFSVWGVAGGGFESLNAAYGVDARNATEIRLQIADLHRTLAISPRL